MNIKFTFVPASQTKPLRNKPIKQQKPRLSGEKHLKNADKNLNPMKNALFYRRKKTAAAPDNKFHAVNP